MKATLWMKAQHEGALTPLCIVRKNPQVPRTAQQVACHSVNNSKGKRVPGPSVFPSGEPGVSGDFWGSQEGCPRAGLGRATLPGTGTARSPAQPTQTAEHGDVQGDVRVGLHGHKVQRGAAVPERVPSLWETSHVRRRRDSELVPTTQGTEAGPAVSCLCEEPTDRELCRSPGTTGPGLPRKPPPGGAGKGTGPRGPMGARETGERPTDAGVLCCASIRRWPCLSQQVAVVQGTSKSTAYKFSDCIF